MDQQSTRARQKAGGAVLGATATLGGDPRPGRASHLSPRLEGDLTLVLRSYADIARGLPAWRAPEPKVAHDGHDARPPGSCKVFRNGAASRSDGEHNERLVRPSPPPAGGKPVRNELPHRALAGRRAIADGRSDPFRKSRPLHGRRDGSRMDHGRLRPPRFEPSPCPRGKSAVIDLPTRCARRDGLRSRRWRTWCSPPPAASTCVGAGLRRRPTPPSSTPAGRPAPAPEHPRGSGHRGHLRDPEPHPACAGRSTWEAVNDSLVLTGEAPNLAASADKAVRLATSLRRQARAGDQHDRRRSSHEQVMLKVKMSRG